MKKRDINVLVIDDDAAIRSTLFEAIKKYGYTPLAVANSSETLSLLRIKTIHCAVVDCMLPKINGIDLVEKMRQTRFRDGVVFLMSGIFKDKTFANDAIKKTRAISFLQKPFDIKELSQLLDEQLSHLCTETTVPLHALISKGYESPRERRKAIELLEEISGFDLPFVLSVLMDAKVGGHLNIVNTAGEIYGISLCKGKVTKVDSSETIATLTLLLMQKGLVTSEDLVSLGEKARKGDILMTLLDEALISPHSVPLVKNEQILIDLKRLFTNDSFQFNFSPERVKKDRAGVTLDDLSPLFQMAIRDLLTEDYLNEFYNGWGDYPILEGPGFDQVESMSSFELVQVTPGISGVARERATINELVASERYNKKELLRALHFLTMKRVIIFDTVKRDAGAENIEDRYVHILKAIKNKNPYQIFAYFGSSKEAKPTEVEKIYKDFAKNNHPDKLPKTATDKDRKLANEVFSRVSDAYDILTHSEKRVMYDENIKQEDAKLQIQAEELAEKGLEFLRKGRGNDSYKILKEAYEMYQSLSIVLYYTWAELKAFPDPKREQLLKIKARMEAIPHIERRNAQYQFVSGLVKKANGDLIGASAAFDKSLTYDVDFLEARRELAALTRGTTGPSFTAKDLLTGDLSEIVGSMFKKKK